MQQISLLGSGGPIRKQRFPSSGCLLRCETFFEDCWSESINRSSYDNGDELIFIDQEPSLDACICRGTIFHEHVLSLGDMQRKRPATDKQISPTTDDYT